MVHDRTSQKEQGNRLYLDYVQHHEGKTIVAPYSPRGNELLTIATPLNWDEVGTTLRPEQFTINSTMEPDENNRRSISGILDK